MTTSCKKSKKNTKWIPLFKVHMPESVLPRLKKVLFSGYIAEGEEVETFEESLRKYIGNPYLVATNSCTSAIRLALEVIGVRPEDDIITSPLTCVATNVSIANIGARVIWGDIDPNTGHLSPKSIEQKITKKTKAIVYVHWAGDPGFVDEINKIGKKYGIKVIEDAAQAFGAEYKEKKIGNTKSDFVCFSFQAIKHLTTGDGGMLAMAQKKDFKKAETLKWFGIRKSGFRDKQGEIKWDEDIPVLGFKFNMNNINGAIGIEQMKYVKQIVARHRKNGEYYIKTLTGIPGLQMLKRPPFAKSAFWVFTMLAEKRDDLLNYLHEHGIHASKLHVRNDIYSGFKNVLKSDLPGVESFSKKYISIPCGWWITQEDIEYIINTIKKGW